MEGLRVDKTYFPEVQEKVAEGKLSEDKLRGYLYAGLSAPTDIDELLENGEGELTEEDCDRIGTDLPPGLYRHIRVTTDGKRPKILATFYMRTVDGVLDELWLARRREDIPPNPADGVADWPSFIPSLVGEPIPAAPTGHQRARAKILPDAEGSQGVEGMHPVVHVELLESPDGDHRWQFPNLKVRSTILAPILLTLRNANQKRVSLARLNRSIEWHQVALKEGK